MNTTRQHHVWFLIVMLGCGMLSACAGPGPASVKREAGLELVWPPAPAKARIKYIGDLSHPEDLGITKGLLGILSEVASGEEDDSMVLPLAVVENGSKQIFVADPGVKAVHRYDRQKGRYHSIKRAGGKGFVSPVGLAADKAGNIYVTDSELAKVFVIGAGDDEAAPLALQDDFVRPTGIAVDGETGWIYVVDTGVHTISVFKPDNTLLRKFGRRGSAEGEFNFPTYIWQNRDGQLLVTDSLNFRIQRFDRHGRFIGRFGHPGDAMGDLSRPKGVAEDSYGHVYVVDSLFHNVQLFDESGSLLMNFGIQGGEPGEFWLPVGIYIDADDTVYVCDSYNQRVQIFQYIGGE
ncbi:MAG: 6-bladed beta-propeller [Candidatus Thiodiazotropha sp. (ex Dulcina madagascariensis)]|nr:6-bladed beta-propeller [Candidatus Thiodiazotropha sp. (ex Dulcina madagascariensis)]